MSLGFLHGGIALLGLAAAAIPIILHLLLKQRPRPIVFPALQLIRQKHTSTVRRLRLQHLLLLAMRIGLFVLLGLALARPTLHSELFSIDQKAPVAMMLVMDTSMSMQYKHRGKSRLEEAAELARKVVNEAPDGSDIMILDSSVPERSIPGDIPSALSKLGSLEIQPARRPLNDSLSFAYRGLAKARWDRREVYVFTDMTAAAWDLAGASSLQADAALVDAGIKLYVMNVGVEKPENVSLGELRLAQQVISEKSDLEIPATVRALGPAVDGVVKLTMDGQPKDSRAARVPAGQAVTVQFNVAAVNAGLHQGQVEVASGDGMPFDNTRYFTVEARPAIRTLVVVDQPDDAVHWTNALVPEILKQQGRAPFAIDTIPSTDLNKIELAHYAVVAIINVGTLDAAGWHRLDNFVQSGGGLFVALGERVDKASYDSEPAQAILPGKLEDEVNSAEGVFLAPDQYSHPLMAKFRQWGTSDLPDLVVQRYIKVAPREGKAVVVIPYGNGDPALLERTFGEGKRGRCVMLTTAAHYRPSADTWTELPRGWSYLALAHQITRYLAGTAESKWNFLAGQPVVLELDADESFGVYSVTDPAGNLERLSVAANESVLRIPSARLLGNYRVDASENGRQFTRGFSVNEPGDESELAPVDNATLEKLLGKERMVVARDPSEFEGVMGEARVGRELFPFLMVLVVTLLVAETYFANRFYRQAKAVSP
ncbi:MAG: BatA domain-containing protein [Planctomycetota bacterium]